MFRVWWRLLKGLSTDILWSRFYFERESMAMFLRQEVLTLTHVCLCIPCCLSPTGNLIYFLLSVVYSLWTFGLLSHCQVCTYLNRRNIRVYLWWMAVPQEPRVFDIQIKGFMGGDKLPLPVPPQEVFYPKNKHIYIPVFTVSPLHTLRPFLRLNEAQKRGGGLVCFQ